jgi:hypothetical protein
MVYVKNPFRKTYTRFAYALFYSRTTLFSSGSWVYRAG